MNCLKALEWSALSSGEGSIGVQPVQIGQENDSLLPGVSTQPRTGRSFYAKERIEPHGLIVRAPMAYRRRENIFNLLCPLPNGLGHNAGQQRSGAHSSAAGITLLASP